jgi:hypothetical protein
MILVPDASFNAAGAAEELLDARNLTRQTTTFNT